MLRSWQLFALGSAFFAALTAVLGKLGVAHVNSNMATLIRAVIIFAVTLAIVAMRGEWQRPASLSASTWLFLVLSGVATGLSWLCYFRALQLGPVSGVAPLDKLSVAMAILIGWIVLGEPLTLKTAIGGALIVGGALVLVL
ncbi:EamA family transporter [Pandoraea nosoerga]|uniref:Membrane protein n=1 Tax=Pandoraea nosoerga TaxID=2508296 RepID=A0A5E4Y089_9BURK|nr:EamA family transporter [Pandoraea nosoerga]MBN4666491.1 EamA family transporter [Pandoraea nosoerga]MBN4677516.1 EamA family transporter [Pandoraea nosoerga]MBN4682336.1 EamA family transporter [Pandoraea nosoerga]MBN4745651.1 EamA family transporter [Pandoraea nosoerga]VVE41957.1 membrane protein [Pandoraea nosoerga]